MTKPVVYDHFETRTGLLVALYQEYDARQSRMLEQALARCDASLASRAWVIAEAYVDCAMSQGLEIPGVSAALAGSPEMEALKRAYEQPFLDKCREALAGFSPSGTVGAAGMRLLVGAADALSQAAAAGELRLRRPRPNCRPPSWRWSSASEGLKLPGCKAHHIKPASFDRVIRLRGCG